MKESHGANTNHLLYCLQTNPKTKVAKDRKVLGVLWWSSVRTRAFTAMGQGSIPGWGNKVPQAVWCRRKTGWESSIDKEEYFKHMHLIR